MDKTNSDYNEAARYLAELAGLMAEGQGETKRANSLRDNLAHIEDRLPDHQVKTLRDLSSDLYMLEDDEVYDPRIEGASDRQYVMGQVRDAIGSNDWHLALRLLRQPLPFLRPDHRAYLRARAYEGIGDFASAYAFMSHASHLIPTDIAYKYLALDYLKTVEPREALKQARAYLRDAATPSAVKIQAASIVFSSTRTKETAAAREYERLAHILASVLGDQALDQTARDVVALGYFILGSSLQAIGHRTLAREALENAQAVAPDNPDVKQALGNLTATYSMHASFVAKGQFQVPRFDERSPIAHVNFGTAKDESLFHAMAA